MAYPILQEQYEYLHLAILHALTFDCKSIPAENFITYYSKIIKKTDGSSEIDNQFKVGILLIGFHYCHPWTMYCIMIIAGLLKGERTS